MTYTEMLDKIHSAGAWFVGVFMGEFLSKKSQYSMDRANRVAFIQYIHHEYGENLGYTYDSTKTKCYALMSIIEDHMVEKALDHILRCNEHKIGREPIENAERLIEAMREGKVRIP